jgi:hypothetical protein
MHISPESIVIDALRSKHVLKRGTEHLLTITLYICTNTGSL